MQGRYGVDNFARFTLGVALFVIVVGSFMRQNAAGGVLDTVGFILIIYYIFQNPFQKYLCTICGKPEISGIYSENPQPVYQREKYDGAEKNTSYLYLPGLWTENSYSQRKRQKVEIECPKCHEKFIKRR